jgi:hypothetical protein
MAQVRLCHLWTAARSDWIQAGEGAWVLYCVECGCCSELGRGWVATRCDDPDPDIALYCPPCAAAEFGFRPDVAANYVCAWEPRPLERRRLDGP